MVGLPFGVSAQSATEAPASTGTLEEVIITAQKRTEKLQDVPVSAAVVPLEKLNIANAGDISGLSDLVPSANLNATLNGRVPLGMRGITSNSNESTVGLPSGVSITVDGVPVPSDSQSANQLEDLERIEVLKGPQATLGGRTASAGVINLVTRGPSDHWTGNASATFTDDHEYRVSGFVAGPIVDKLDFSLSTYYNKRTYPITNIADDKKTYQEPYGVRGKLMFKPSDDLDITLMGRYASADTYGFNLVYSYVTPGAYLLLGPNPPPLPPAALAALSQETTLAGITPSWDNQAFNSPVKTVVRVRDRDASLIIDYRIGRLTLTSTTAMQTEHQDNIQDLFANANYFWNDFAAALGAPLPPFPNYQEILLDVRQFTEELKLTSPTDEAFSYLVGVFYSDSTVGQTYMRDLPPALNNYYVKPDTKTTAPYARVTWRFRPETALVVGMRVNFDDISYEQHQYAVCNGLAPGCPNPFSSSGSNQSTTFVGDINLKHDLNPRSMIYGGYTRGYAPAVYNTSLALASNAPVEPVGKTTIDHFEIGSKGTYFDRQLSFNVAIFDTLYKDYQIQSYSAIPGYVAPPLILTSAGKAETRGIEADMAWAATALSRVWLSAAYIDAKFKDYPNAPCWVGQTVGCNVDPATGQGVQNVSGATMPISPKFKGTVGMEHRIPLSGGGYDVILAGSYSYRSSAQMLPDQNPQAIQDAFGLLNLSVGIAEKGGRWSATVFGNNLTDKHYAGDVEDFWSGPWGSNAVVIQPARDSHRYFGIRLNAGF